MKSTLYIILTILIFSAIQLSAQNSAQSVYDSFIEKYGNINSVSVKFKVKEDPKLRAH